MASEAQSQIQQPLSAEEEALKRNTDCVYFLASPLTCKKGNECEYRHSEIARLNPRDCWYWVNSSCLNPKCAFRHPPLEGVVGAQTPTSTGPSVPQAQTATATAPYVANTAGKQGVPCVFFQKGYCLKGDWCPFLHAPSSSSNKTLPVPAPASSAEPTAVKKAVVGLEKSVQEKKAQTIPVAKYLNNVQQVKAMVNFETSAFKNEFAADRRVQQASAANEFPGYRNIPPISNGNQVKWSNRVQQPQLLDELESMNSKEEDEVSREPSPGFDVLVDDEGRDSDYYPGEDIHGMSIEHERNEYDIGHSNDYVDLDDERYQIQDPLGYDSHERHQGQYAWEQQRASSERMSGGSYLERRPYARNNSHVQVDETDLRHRLSGHKKPNGLRSVISRGTREMHVQDRSDSGSYRESNARDNALSSRLRGRIRLPGRSSSPDNSRQSPGRTTIAPLQGRIRERIKGQVDDSYNSGWRTHRSPNIRGDDIRENKVNFAGPKSLAELKSKKIDEPSGRHSADQKPLGKRKHSIIDDHQQSGVNPNFEGPKSLEEILKRKRGETSGSKSIEGKKHVEENDSTTKEVNNPSLSHKKEDDENKPHADNSVRPSITSTMIEEGEHVDEGVELEGEAYEQKDGEYNYEQTGGEDYEYYDGEIGDAGEEYVEDEDEEDEDDDFAKKMGVMYS